MSDDQWQEELHKATLADAAMGRMSQPRAAVDSQAELSQVLFHPRFGVEQGVRADGTVKVRPVDHFSWSNAPRGSRAQKKAGSVNGSCALPESIAHDHLDSYAVAMHRFIELVDELPGQWKSDIDSAFRLSLNAFGASLLLHVIPPGAYP